MDDDRWAPEIKRKICQKCDAPCCRDKDTLVVLDREAAERRLKDYKYENMTVGLLFGYKPILKKRKDGSCVYFDLKTNKCSIYKKRPAACKAWFCGKGTVRNMIWLALKGRGNGLSTM